MTIQQELENKSSKGFTDQQEWSNWTRKARWEISPTNSGSRRVSLFLTGKDGETQRENMKFQIYVVLEILTLTVPSFNGGLAGGAEMKMKEGKIWNYELIWDFQKRFSYTSIRRDWVSRTVVLMSMSHDPSFNL